MEAGSLSAAGGGRSVLERSPLARLPDRLLRWGLTALAVLILLLIAFFFVRLYAEAKPAFDRFGVFGFTFDNNWDVSRNVYGALPLVVGTLITSAVALLIGVPVAVATALYVTELRAAPRARSAHHHRRAAGGGAVGRLRPLGRLRPDPQAQADRAVDLRHVQLLPFIGGGTVAGPNYFIGGLILAIMIIPIVSAISREVMATVPVEHKEAALALGATRWEMIRMAVLPYSRAGITGASMLGLGRAIGETIAVTLVIGNAPQIGEASSARATRSRR